MCASTDVPQLLLCACMGAYAAVMCARAASACARAACCFRSIGTQLGELARVRWLGCFVRARTRSSRSSRRWCLRLGGCCSFPPWICAPHFHEAGPWAGGGEESERRNGGAAESERARTRADGRRSERPSLARSGPERTRVDCTRETRRRARVRYVRHYVATLCAGRDFPFG